MQKMRAVFFDCPTGASGNMILASLIDAGGDIKKITSHLKRMPVPGWKIKLSTLKKHGVAGLHLEVDYTPQPERNLKEIISLIRKAKFKPEVEKKAVEVFSVLAKAEAQVHKTTIDKIHFHEVGAIDSIIDIVGAVLALDDLKIEKIYSSPLNVGWGTVKCRHGVLPVPAPATAQLLKKAVIYQNDISGELVTPTGAALLACLADSFGQMPSISLQAVGHGAGTMDLSSPNIIRAMVGVIDEPKVSNYPMVLLETNIDDMNPQIFGHVMDRLFKAGAADVFFTSIQMKKNRPGTMLSVLVSKDREKDAVNILMAETTTLGIRRYLTERYVLQRKPLTVKTKYGPIKAKVGILPDGSEKIQPEYDSCIAAVEKYQIPLKAVMASAIKSIKALE
jgi:uncharacterized protein (TIGR00299 family) protein